MAPRYWHVLIAILLFSVVSACSGIPQNTPALVLSSTSSPEATTPLPQTTPTITAVATSIVPQPTPSNVDYWKDWPILPVVSDHAKAIYEHGLQLGTNPHLFAVFGDCQSMPNVFMAVYDEDADLVAQLPANLQETIHYFSGSFSQNNPTIWPGTDFAAILWDGWVQPIFNYCKQNETPLDCVLRVRNPSIVLINLGTHYEERNYEYLTDMLQQLIDQGVLPVLALKADDREGNDSLNGEIAQAAIQFDIPVWNFYRAASALVNHGLKHSPDDHDIYLTNEGLELHRYSALQALDSVWRQLTAK